MVLEPHDERDPGADSLAAREADSSEGFEHARLSGGLVSDDDDGRELNSFLHYSEVPKPVDRVEEGTNPVVAGRNDR